MTEDDNNPDNVDPIVYCTTIPCPTDTYVWWDILNLNAGRCYNVKLERWRYSELGNTDNALPDNMKQFFTGELDIVMKV